jgi:hypothetical protein
MEADGPPLHVSPKTLVFPRKGVAWCGCCPDGDSGEQGGVGLHVHLAAGEQGPVADGCLQGYAISLAFGVSSQLSPVRLAFDPCTRRRSVVAVALARLRCARALCFVFFRSVWLQVKTTAVNRYMVRPNVGILMPGKTVEVAVLLNYDKTRAEGVDLAATHDRFQVLSVGMKNAAEEERVEVWTRTPEERLGKTTVKCKFVAPNLVKTVIPAVPGTPEPGLEQAKYAFKQEMASSKVKQELKAELKALRAERDAAVAAAKEKEVENTRLLGELAKWRNPAPKGLWARARSALFFVLVYVAVLAVFFVTIYKAFDYDPFYSISRELSLSVVEQKLKRYLLTTLK